MSSTSSSSSEDDMIVLAAVQSSRHSGKEFSDGGGWKGRAKGSRGNIRRGECSWWRDYLCVAPTYPASHFRRRFRIPLKLYRRIVHDLPLIEPDLLQRIDATGRPGAHTWQKVLCALRSLGDGVSFSSLDDKARMSIESMRQSFRMFLRAMIKCSGKEFLNRVPSSSELRAIESRYATRHFPGCIGALDCMHLVWKNCPKAWKGQFHNPKSGKLATVQVEGWCDSDLYCWHIFVGRPGTNNDITVAENSPLIMSILSGERCLQLQGGYVLAGKVRNWIGYFLTDGIYPEWAIFVKPNHAPTTEKERAMTKAQESTRKDVERLFGVLQGRFLILRHEFHSWSDDELVDVMNVCVILHNMLVRLRLAGELDDETDEFGNVVSPEEIIGEFYESEEDGNTGSGTQNWGGNGDPNSATNAVQVPTWFAQLMGCQEAIRNPEAHKSLRSAVEDHVWSTAGNQYIP